MSEYDDMVAAFIAKNGVKKIETGARAYDPRDIYRARRGGGVAVSIDDKITAESEKRYHDEYEAHVSDRLAKFGHV